MDEHSIIIRKIDLMSEMHDVEELQKEVWGVPDIEIVPVSQLVGANVSGGVLLGAFDGDILAGFVYGFVGLERGKTIHHSHMLAVKPGYRTHNLGQRLKLEQRKQVLQQGITIMTWTFDPLQSLNAYFNFGKLGVITDRYFVDFYGNQAASFLHQNSTDRLWVTWLLESEKVRQKMTMNAVRNIAGFSTLVEIGENDRPYCNLGVLQQNDLVVIEVPADINQIERLNREVAVEWREATRTAFIAAFAEGFVAQDFCRVGLGSSRFGAYILERGKN